MRMESPLNQRLRWSPPDVVYTPIDVTSRRAIDAYNREVRSYNARVRANQSRLRSAVQSLSTRTITVRYRSFHTSAAALYSAYERLDNSDADPFLSDIAERDTANSVTLLNTLLGDSSHDRVGDGELTSTKLSESLSRYPTDMQDRWSGAIFALNPRNPDSARHFCTRSLSEDSFLETKTATQ